MSDIYSPSGEHLQSRGKFHAWLERYRVFFETVAAVLLSVMAILVSAFQGCIAQRQTRLLETQTEVAVKQLASEERRERINNIGHFNELRKMCRNITSLFPGTPIDTMSMSASEWRAWFEKVAAYLISEVRNPVLNATPPAQYHYQVMLQDAEAGRSGAPEGFCKRLAENIWEANIDLEIEITRPPEK